MLAAAPARHRRAAHRPAAVSPLGRHPGRRPRGARRTPTNCSAPSEQLRAERDATVDWLRAAGLQAADSDANFVLFGVFDDRHAVWQGLLDRGVLIRETGPDGWLRVSIGTAAEMAAFRTALQEVSDDQRQ